MSNKKDEVLGAICAGRKTLKDVVECTGYSTKEVMGITRICASEGIIEIGRSIDGWGEFYTYDVNAMTEYWGKTVKRYIKKKETDVTKIDESKYVKVTNATLANVLKANVKENTVSCWALTVAYMNNIKALDTYDANASEKAIGDALRTAFKSAFMMDYFALVAKGDRGAITKTTRVKNVRTGNMMDLVNAKGEVKFNSWGDTINTYKYMSVMAKMIKAGVIADVVKTSGKATLVLNLRDAKKYAGIEDAVAKVETKDAKIIRLTNELKAAAKDVGMDVIIKVA